MKGRQKLRHKESEEMSKERLEEIKEKYNYERLGEFIDAKLVNPYELKWLIEQAERVQELENEYQVRQIEYLEEHIDRLEQQNKRYREAIIEALHGLKTLPSVAPRLYLISILDKALEGDLE